MKTVRCFLVALVLLSIGTFFAFAMGAFVAMSVYLNNPTPTIVGAVVMVAATAAILHVYDPFEKSND